MQGTRFSLIYLNRDTPTRDSQRFRNRLAAFYWEQLHNDHREGIRRTLEKEAGIEVPFIMNFGYSVDNVFKKGQLRDVLDSISLIYQYLKSTNRSAYAESWKSFVKRALQEENVGYSIDDACGVHYFVDEEFERSRTSTLAVFDHSSYAGVRAAYDDAFRHIDADPPDTKASVRSMFESVEILVRQMINTKNLNKWIVENHLKERCLALYKDDSVASKVVGGLFDSFARWVDALHDYRHGQGIVEPVRPDERLTIHVLSTGSSYLRWLAEMDRALKQKEKESGAVTGEA